jgi:hypothetical protein
MTTALQKIRIKREKSQGPGADVFRGAFEKQLASMSEKVVKQIAEKMAAEMLQNGQLMHMLARLAVGYMPMSKLKGSQGDRGARGPKGDQGIQGEKGDRGEKGEKGSDGEDGQDFFNEEQKAAWLKEVVSKILNEGVGEGDDIVKKINALAADDPDLQIDWAHIKNAPKKNVREGAKLGEKTVHRGGLKLIWNTQLEGTINGINTIFTIPQALPSPQDDRYFVSSRGVLKDEDSGDFTISADNRTITFTAAPPNGSARPRIPIYHAH